MRGKVLFHDDGIPGSSSTTTTSQEQALAAVQRMMDI